LDVNYVGNPGTRMLTVDINRSQLDPKYLPMGQSALNTLVPNPFYGAIPAGTSSCALDQPTIVQSQLLQPYPQYCGVPEGDAPRGFSIYNALQANYNHRFSKGLPRSSPIHIPNSWTMWKATTIGPAAIASFKQANLLKSSLYVPQLFLGIDYMRTGKAKQPIPQLLSAVKMKGTDPLPSLTLGRAYSSLGKLSIAIPSLRRATELDPKQGSAWFALGIAYLDQLENDSRTMTAQYPSSPYARALFAESLVKQSRYTEAAGQHRAQIR
jgi:hypothetical protein